MAVSSALMLFAGGGTGSACACARKVSSATTDAAIWKTCLIGILPRVIKVARAAAPARLARKSVRAIPEVMSRERSFRPIIARKDRCRNLRRDGERTPGKKVIQLGNYFDLRLCAPFAQSLRVEGKLALTIKQLVGDLAHARGIFENHSIRSVEIEESRRGCGMTSRSEHHGYSAFGQEIKRAHHVIACGDLMIDVLAARSVRRKQCDRVLDLVDAQRRRVADAVTHPGVAHLGPECLVARRVGSHLLPSGSALLFC